MALYLLLYVVVLGVLCLKFSMAIMLVGSLACKSKTAAWVGSRGELEAQWHHSTDSRIAAAAHDKSMHGIGMEPTG